MFGLEARQPSVSPPVPSSDTPRALITRYCISCHNGAENRRAGARHHRRGRRGATSGGVGESRPEAARAPDAASRTAAAGRSDVRGHDRVAGAVARPRGGGASESGRTDTFRRLNRTEYQNAIRDLLALDVDAAALLPADESSHGFDNVTVGDLSPTLLDRYISAAREDQPAGGRASRPFSRRRHDPDSAGPHPGGARRRAAARHARRRADSLHVPAGRRVRDPDPAGARPQRARRGAERAARARSCCSTGERVQLFTVKPPSARQAEDDQPSHDDVDQHLKVRVPVTAGPHELGVTFLKKPSALLETERQPYQAHFNMHRHPRIQPAVYSDLDHRSVCAERARRHAQPPPDFRVAAGEPGEEEACARRILPTLMRRAYRRPVTDADLQGPLEFYRKARAEGGFDAGIEMALCAPSW